MSFLNDAPLLTSDYEVKVAGSPLSSTAKRHVLEVIVDQHAYLPGMFTIRIYDQDLTFTDGNTFDLTKEIEISGKDRNGTSYTMIKGEITALEPEFQEGRISELVVRGYDKSHRLYRESHSEGFLNTKDSDLVVPVAGQAGLSADAQSTSTVYDHVLQANQTRLEFLQQRAWRIGYECYVTEDGKLHFGKPSLTGSAVVTLNWGTELVTFRPRATLAEQVDEVVVRGWDPATQQAIVGKAKSGELYAKNGEKKDGAKWAGTFGTGKKIIVDQPVNTQAEANELAQARLNEISGAFVQAEGLATRAPQIKAGKLIKLERLGKRFSGDYLVTRARHIYDSSGWRCEFTVRGMRTGLVAEDLGERGPTNRWPGVVTAVVTNSGDDEKDWGRVKVKYDWLGDNVESHWARVANPGAGNNTGFFVIPEVGDEVVVAFEHGDVNRPVILGGLWNGKSPIPDEASMGDNKKERAKSQVWRSRTGHVIAMHDNVANKSANYIEVKTQAGNIIQMDDKDQFIMVTTKGGHSIMMDDKGKSVTISSSGGASLTMDDKAKSVTLKSAGTMTLDAKMIEVKSSGVVSVKGSQISLG